MHPDNGSEPHPEQHPYSRLTPDLVLDALDSVGVRGDGRMLALNSYENRVYLVYLEDGSSVVAKFYRPNIGGTRWTDTQILEEHHFTTELAQLEIPVVAPLPLQSEAGTCTLAHFGGFRFAVMPRRGGRAPELDAQAVLPWIGRFMGRIHAVGAAHRFKHREAADIATVGMAPRDWLLAHWFDRPDGRPEVYEIWRTAADAALGAVRECFAAAGDVAQIRLHGDCHAGNILWLNPSATDPGGPHFVDFDDARQGPAMQDLWMLLSGDRSYMTRQLGELIDGYEAFMEFDRRELHLLEALRTLRIIHHSAWLARRWDDPAFAPAFPWFGTPAYWQEQAHALLQQVQRMAEPPLAV
jgi:Ser/Thr protein kinase RdoA (MazF antagonist)